MRDPEDYRDTLPPSCDEFELEKGKTDLAGVSKTSTRKLIAEIACGVAVLKEGQQQQYDLLMRDHEEVKKLAGRVTVLERYNAFGSRIPLAVSGIALVASLLAMSVAAIQGWTMVATANAQVRR